MNKIAYQNYKHVEGILLNREKLIAKADNMCSFIISDFGYRVSRYHNNQEKQLEYLREEIKKTLTQLDNPYAHFYITLAHIDDIEGYLKTLKGVLEEQSEEESLFNFSTLLDTVYNIPNEQSNKLLEEIFEDPEKNLSATKQDVVKVWAWQHFYSILLMHERDLNSKVNTVNQEDDEQIPNNSELSNAQRTLAVMLVNKFLKLNKSQDKKSLQDFIFNLTYRNYREIGDKMKAIADSDFKLHASPKQCETDYKAVRTLFAQLEQKEIIEFIDQKIKYFQEITVNNKNYWGASWDPSPFLVEYTFESRY